MPTITVTDGHMILMQSTDIVAIHLLIVAQGVRTGRAFTVPASKTIRQYSNDQVPIEGTLGLVGSVVRGTLRPYETATAGYRTADYALTPIRKLVSHPVTTPPDTTPLLRYVEQSRRAQPERERLEALHLGYGVPCDILCLRSRRVSSWLSSGMPRLSQLLRESLLTQYAHIHCLLRCPKRSGSASRG